MGRRRARAVAGIAPDFGACRFHASPAPRKAETGGVVRGSGRSITLDPVEGLTALASYRQPGPAGAAW